MLAGILAPTQMNARTSVFLKDLQKPLKKIKNFGRSEIIKKIKKTHLNKSKFLEFSKMKVTRNTLYPTAPRVARRRRKILCFYASKIQFSFRNQAFWRIFTISQIRFSWKKSNLVKFFLVKTVKKIKKKREKKQKSEIFWFFWFFSRKKSFKNTGEGHLGGSIRGEARRKRNVLCFIWSASVGIRGNERYKVRNFLNWSFKMWISRRKQNRRRRQKFWGFRVPYCRFLTMFSFPERFPRPPRTVFRKIFSLRRAKNRLSAYGKSFGEISLMGKVLGETPTPKGEVAVSP